MYRLRGRGAKIKQSTRQYAHLRVAVALVLIFARRPKIIPFGVVYRAQNALFGKGDILADVFDEVFHIFALRFVIHRARIVDDGQTEARDGGFDVVFLDIDTRADKGYARFVHISGGSEAREATFVQERQEHRFGNVVGVVTEGKLASAEADYLVVERASAHFGAKGARILLFACIEYDFSDIRLYEVVFDSEAVAVGNKGVHFLLFGVFKPHIHSYGLEVEVLGREASIRRKRAQKQGAVLSARQAHEYFVIVVNHVVILHGSAHRTQYFLHKKPPSANIIYSTKLYLKAWQMASVISQIALT